MSGAVPLPGPMPNDGPQPIGNITPMQAGQTLAPRPASVPPALWQPAQDDPILDAPKPRTGTAMWLGYIVVAVFVVGLGVWASLVPLAEASIAPGVLKVEGTRRTI